MNKRMLQSAPPEARRICPWEAGSSIIARLSSMTSPVLMSLFFVSSLHDVWRIEIVGLAQDTATISEEFWMITARELTPELKSCNSTLHLKYC